MESPKGRFITWRDLPEDGSTVPGILRAPFHNYNGGGIVEMVFGFESALGSPEGESVRPFALRIGGEGYIRLEKQLGKDITAWPGRWVRLLRGNKRGKNYVEVANGAAVRS